MILLTAFVLTAGIFSVGADSSNNSWDSKTFQVDVPFRSKVSEVKIENEETILRQAEVNQKKLLVKKAYTKIGADQVIKEGDNVSLDMGNGHPLLRQAEEVLSGRALQATNILEGLKVPMTRLHFTQELATGDIIEGWVIAAGMYPGDRRRIELEIESLQKEGAEDNKDSILYFEKLLSTQEAIGLVTVISKEQGSALYGVAGKLGEHELELSSVLSSSKLFEPSDEFLDSVLDVRFNRQTADQIRDTYVQSAGTLQAEAAHSHSQSSYDKPILFEANKGRVNVSLRLSKSSSRLLNGSLSVDVHEWTNEGRLQEDRQQVVAFALQGKELDRSVPLSVALIMTYAPDFPSDDFVCASHISRHILAGSVSPQGSGRFSRIYPGENAKSVWELMYASLDLAPTDSKVSSWSYVPARAEKLATQDIYSGLKVFVNTLDKHSVKTFNEVSE